MGLLSMSLVEERACVSSELDRVVLMHEEFRPGDAHERRWSCELRQHASRRLDREERIALSPNAQRRSTDFTMHDGQRIDEPVTVGPHKRSLASQDLMTPRRAS
jgi:hypothetical protein